MVSCLTDFGAEQLETGLPRGAAGEGRPAGRATRIQTVLDGLDSVLPVFERRPLQGPKVGNDSALPTPGTARRRRSAEKALREFMDEYSNSDELDYARQLEGDARGAHVHPHLKKQAHVILP